MMIVEGGDDEYEGEEGEEGEEEDNGDNTSVLRLMDEFYPALDQAGVPRRVEVVIRETSSDTVELWQITVPAEERGKGYASRVLNVLTTLADKHGVFLELEPAANMDHTDRGLTTEQLRRWYAKWGFQETGCGDQLGRIPRTNA